MIGAIGKLCPHLNIAERLTDLLGLVYIRFEIKSPINSFSLVKDEHVKPECNHCILNHLAKGQEIMKRKEATYFKIGGHLNTER